MLKRLFTSNSRIAILNLLMFNQDNQFHLREIAKRIGVTPIHVSKELENLSKAGLVVKYSKANLSLYSINRRSPLLEDLRRLFLKTDYLGEAIRSKLAGRAEYCLIYGSFARGDESESSDIDLFVVSGMPEDELLDLVRRLEKTARREINYVLWDEKTFQERKRDHLVSTIKAGPIIMLLGDEDEFRNE